jgi:hypothetical protein
MKEAAMTSFRSLIVLTLSLCPFARAVEFAGGTGEPNEPYQIATAAQLIDMANDSSMYNKCFVLTADINLDPALPGRQIFQHGVMSWWTCPPGWARCASAPFEGCFDGRGHVIRNCTIMGTNSTYPVSLFNSVASKGVIRNLHIEDILVAGSSLYCTGLVAQNDGTLVNCSVTGTIAATASTSSSTGMYAGLVGRNTGLVVNCRSDCVVFGYAAAGLAGFNDAAGRVVSCSANGVISGEKYSGGLVYENKGMIQFCSADAYLTTSAGGGLVRDNSGTIRESYAAVTLLAGGGLVFVNSGTIVNCYTLPPLSDNYSDGLARENTGTILSSYSTIRSSIGEVHYIYYLGSGVATRPTDYASYSDRAIPLSEDRMKEAASFVGFDFYGDVTDGGADPWFMPPDGYPILSWQTALTGLIGVPDVSGLDVEKAKRLLEYMGFAPGSVTYDYSRLVPAGQALRTQPVDSLAPGSSVGLIVSLGQYPFAENPGDGSEAKPYQIKTASQFESFCSQFALSDKHFLLTADIDLNWYEHSDKLSYVFAGEFNGNGHTIRNLRVLAISPMIFRSVFGAIASTGLVRDLNIEQPYFYAVYGSHAGILAVTNDGQVLRCKTAGQISGYPWTAGGLVAANTGQITECSFSGRIKANATTAGGLVGENSGSITRCGVRNVEVSGGYSVGGLVGDSHRLVSGSAIIEASYATGTVIGTGRVGGLVGTLGRSNLTTNPPTPIPPDALAMVRQCHAACSITGQSDIGGFIGWAATTAQQESCFFLDPNDTGGPDNGLGTPLTAEQMKQQASFPGWDFADTWAICEGRDYPRLRWEAIECDK